MFACRLDVFAASADLVYGPRKMVQPDLFVTPLVSGVLYRVNGA